MPSAPTSSTSPAPPSRRLRGLVGAPLGSASGPRSSGPLTRSPAPPRSSATSVSTSWPPTSSAARPVNNARFVFLDPRAEVFYEDWERVAGECVAILRWAAGRDPHDRDLSDLVGELATQSEAFRTRWAAHDVRFHNTGVKQFHH